jgi:hypothetical protein
MTRALVDAAAELSIPLECTLQGNAVAGGEGIIPKSGGAGSTTNTNETPMVQPRIEHVPLFSLFIPAMSIS